MLTNIKAIRLSIRAYGLNVQLSRMKGYCSPLLWVFFPLLIRLSVGRPCFTSCTDRIEDSGPSGWPILVTQCFDFDDAHTNTHQSNELKSSIFFQLMILPCISHTSLVSSSGPDVCRVSTVKERATGTFSIGIVAALLVVAVRSSSCQKTAIEIPAFPLQILTGVQVRLKQRHFCPLPYRTV